MSKYPRFVLVLCMCTPRTKVAIVYLIFEHTLQENRFSTCDVCAAIREARERTLNPSVREWIGRLLEKHMQLQR